MKKQEKESILEETFAASRRKRVSGRNRKTGNGPVCPWRPLRGSWAVTANGVNKYFWACLWACCEDLKLHQERSRVICLYGGEVSVFRFHEPVKHRGRRYNCALFDQGLRLKGAKMNYINAKAVLPEELIKEIQKYVNGISLYIPQLPRERGVCSYRMELCRRNQEICRLFLQGKKVPELAAQYYLSEKSIYRILGEMRERNENSGQQKA